MAETIRFTNKKTPFLERFGIYYLKLFGDRQIAHHVFDFTDAELQQKVDKITRKGILLSAIVGIMFVWPTVYVSVVFENEIWYWRYAWLIGVNLVCILIEIYLLFIIALKAVDELSDLINIRASKSDLLQQGPFNVLSVLSRAALELPDPEMDFLGIDPFKQISRKNLLVLSLIYKGKIFLTNLACRLLLSYTVGPVIAGVSILYIALPVECFWNGVVLRRVVKEARLRLFGFALCNHIADNVIKDDVLKHVTDTTKAGCLRAIGNAVVMTQNYHPNMIVLLMRFYQLVNIDGTEKLDDWNRFIETLRNVSAAERNLLLDVFTIAAAFDGKLSALEKKNVQEAYGPDYPLYKGRLQQLTGHLKDGRINAAAALSRIDFVAGWHQDHQLWSLIINVNTNLASNEKYGSMIPVEKEFKPFMHTKPIERSLMQKAIIMGSLFRGHISCSNCLPDLKSKAYCKRLYPD